MPAIPFPNVPIAPGVPALVRPISAAIASSPVLAIGLGAVGNILGSALQQAPRWGIFDSSGNQLGVSANIGNPIISALISQVVGPTSPTLSTFSFEYSKEMRVSDFPIEMGGFASYNKVDMPAIPTLTLVLAGSESDRTNFLKAIDTACKSTNLYSVVTPEVTYANYSLDRYRYARRADKGATLLIVEVALKELRQVKVSFAKVATTPITNPQNATATATVNSGMTQAAPSDTSTLKSIFNKLPALAGTN